MIEPLHPQEGRIPRAVQRLAGGPPAARLVADAERVMDGDRRACGNQILAREPKLLATSVFNRLLAEGFDGS